MAEATKTTVLKDGLDPEEYTLRKRLPKKLPKRKCDVYVTRRTNSAAQLKRCRNLLDSGAKEVYIHGLGAAIQQAVNLALQLKASGQGSIQLATNTSTVELVDDLEPQSEHLEPEVQTRNNSAIHIKVFRPLVPLENIESSPTSQ